MKNELIKKSFLLTKDDANNITNISNITTSVDKIYSYIIYNENDKSILNKHNVWKIDCLISSIPYYNTINIKEAIIDILDSICNDTLVSNIAGYKQPTLDIIVEAYIPLIKTISNKLLIKWPNLEFDDIYQLCMIALINLYKSNYYLHKKLIIRACNNEILEYLRKHKNNTDIISIYDMLGSPDENLTIADTIMDPESLYQQTDNEVKVARLQIYNEIKDIIIDRFGPRRFDRLYNAYAKGSGYGNNTAARDLITIKRYLKSQNITKESFNKYL